MARAGLISWIASLAFAFAAPGPKDARRATDAQNFLDQAKVALASGDYHRALQRAEASAGIFRGLNDLANEAVASNVAGSAQLFSGDYELAIATFRHALELDRHRHDTRGEITRLSNIGNGYFFQGKYLDALDCYEQALSIVEENAGEAWSPGRRQLVLTNLATLYEQLGQNETALRYYQQALAGGAVMTPGEHAQLLSNVGTVYRRLGDAAKALDTYQAAQKLFAREHQSDGEIHVLQNVGLAEALDFHDWKRALRAFTEALTLAESTSNRRETVLAHLFRGEAFYRSGQGKEANRDFAEALRGARGIGATEEQWTALYGLGRIQESEGESARALSTYGEAIAAIEAVRTGLGASSLKAEFLANKRDVYDAAISVMLRTPGQTPEQLFGMFEKARSRNLQDLLHAALRSTLAPAALQPVQRRLAKGSLLIEYWTSNSRIAALWITPERAGVVSRELTPQDARSLRELGATLRDARDTSWRAPAARVGGLLLAGIPLDAGIAQVLIVPDGILYSIPFELLSRKPSAPLLIERFPVSYLPSAALLMREPGERTLAAPWLTQLIAFGDPVRGAHGELSGEDRWGRLPQSGRELRSIAHALPGRAALHVAEGDQKHYLFDGGVAGVPLLHFSTHAAVDIIDPNRSRILFTPEAGKKGSEYLFRSEVQELRLAGADLVTLSACDTEGGKLSRGEGIQSFSSAFLAAGARSTVTTLWRVADGPTADFMQRFYQHLARGETKAEALRAAKLSFLRSGSAVALPLYWAAFVLNGDGETPIRPVLSWIWIIAPACAIFLVSVLFSALYRFQGVRYLRRRPAEAEAVRQ